MYRRVQFEYPPNTKTSYQNFEGSIFEYARIQAALPNRLVGGLLEGLTSISHTIQRAVTLSPASGLRGGVAARSRRARSPRAVAARHQAPNTRRRALRQISTPPRPPEHDHSSQPKMCQRTSAKTPPNTAPRTKKSRLIAGITWNSIARNSPAICSGVLTPPVRGTGERERASPSSSSPASQMPTFGSPNADRATYILHTIPGNLALGAPKSDSRDATIHRLVCELTVGNPAPRVQKFGSPNAVVRQLKNFQAPECFRYFF